MSADDPILSELQLGNINTFSQLDNYFKEVICDSVRTNPNRLKILSSCFSKLKEQHPYYAFLMTYDLTEYTDFTKDFFYKSPSILINNRLYYELLELHPWVVSYTATHITRIVQYNFDNTFVILKYAITHNKSEWIKQLIYNDDMLIRVHTMYTIIDDFPRLFTKLYPDPLSVCKMTSKDGSIQIADESYLSKIAILIVLNLNNIPLYQEFKNFILTNYTSNTLASIIDCYIIVENDETLKKLLITDIDSLFISSKNYKWQLYQHYQEYLSPHLTNDFYNLLKPFINIFPNEVIEGMCTRGLLSKFIELANKYLALSTKAKCITNAGEGTCSYVYRVGDYIIKYSDKKYSFEPTICPNLYLIAKNYEEVINRDSRGQVTGALEVQKYYSKAVLPSEEELLTKWQEALRKEGYYLVDNLVGQKVGSNCYFLDDYHDADTNDPETLPEWFKKDPIVLVDRDLIYKYKPSSN